MKRVALFDTVPDMKTFDISVNVLNEHVLSDKLLWKERGVSRSSGPRAPDVPPPKQALVPGERTHVESTQVGTQLFSGCLQRPPVLPLETSLVTLPLAFLGVFVIILHESAAGINAEPIKPDMFLSDLNAPRLPSSSVAHASSVCTLVGCALLLATPAMLLVWQQRTSAKKHVYVDLLLLHEAALFVVLRPVAIPGVFVVFAAIFAQLCFHNTTWRKSSCLMALANIATAAVLLQQIIAGPSTFPETHFGVMLFSAFVVLFSTSFYAYYVIF
jgi:hypothetical protein